MLDAGAWYLVAARMPGNAPTVLPVSWARATAPSLHDFCPAVDFDLRRFWSRRAAERA